MVYKVIKTIENSKFVVGDLAEDDQEGTIIYWDDGLRAWLKIEPSELPTYFEPVKEEVAVRADDGKLQYDLLHPLAQEGLVQVLSYGANKYSARNYEKGLDWSRIINSLYRHLEAFRNGEDIDKESLLLHVDHIQANAHMLAVLFRTFPQGDDRRKT